MKRVSESSRIKRLLGIPFCLLSWSLFPLFWSFSTSESITRSRSWLFLSLLSSLVLSLLFDLWSLSLLFDFLYFWFFLAEYFFWNSSYLSFSVPSSHSMTLSANYFCLLISCCYILFLSFSFANCARKFLSSSYIADGIAWSLFCSETLCSSNCWGTSPNTFYSSFLALSSALNCLFCNSWI